MASMIPFTMRGVFLWHMGNSVLAALDFIIKWRVVYNE